MSDVHLSPSPNPRHHNYLWPTLAATYPAVEIRSYFNVGVGKPGITLFLEVVMMDITNIYQTVRSATLNHTQCKALLFYHRKETKRKK